MKQRRKLSARVMTLMTVIMLMAATAVSCRISYKFNGAALDYSIYRTVNIGQFPIRAALVYPPLQQTFENKLMDYVTRNTRLQVVDGPSDLQIEGEITGYNLSPQAVSEDGYGSQTRLTVQVHVRYTNNKEDNKDIDQTFSAYRDFDSSQMLTDVQDQLIEEISDELVNLIFNATLGDW